MTRDQGWEKGSGKGWGWGHRDSLGPLTGLESGAQSVLSHRYLCGREFLAPGSPRRT